jgi:hypothetical protein
MRFEDAQARVSYVLALMNGTPRNVAFEVALGRWRAQNTGADEATARRALVRILAQTVWIFRENLGQRRRPLAWSPGEDLSRSP